MAARFEAGVHAAPPAPAGDPLADVDPVELTAERIQRDYRAGKYTAVQLTQAYLDRIARYEPVYNAFISMNPAAIEIAAALDAEYEESGPRGPLHGVPVVIKDNLDYAGLVTTAGYAGFSRAAGGVDMIPDADAVAVERLRRAGAIVLGKTNLPDFAGDGTRTRSSVAGVTRNATDLDRVPGGSSGGTATAVNASFAVLGLGTETGGSIQNPASAQGLVGLKPTFGLVPLAGVVPVDAIYHDVVGPIARSVEDAATALDVIAGPSRADAASPAGAGHVPVGGYASKLDRGALRGKRFGLVGAGWRRPFPPLAPETAELYRRAVAVLEGQGAEVVEDPFAGSGFAELYQEQPRAPRAGAHDLRAYLVGLGPGAAFHSVEEWERLTGRRFPGGGRPLPRPAGSAAEAYGAWRARIHAVFRKVLEDNRLDGLFFPQAAGPIPPLIEDPERPEYSPNDYPEIPSNVVNDIGLPVLTLPADRYADGMPFNVAFIGDLWQEPDMVGWAYAFEQATKARRAPVLVRRPPGGR